MSFLLLPVQGITIGHLLSTVHVTESITVMVIKTK